ncbi:MAG TPA: hypothetical protein PKH77_01495 [Anaerolineae bacterium]|nr:hypothetical protein [Anaerolineae bacterium]
MIVQFLSIVIFTFSLTLLVLGAVTWWIERERKRVLGVWMIASGLFIAIGYALLGSRFSIAWFGRLIVAVDLPLLWATAILYTIGVLGGIGLAGGIFMWMSGRLTRLKPTRIEKQLAAYIGVILLVALVISLIAVLLSR